MNPFLTSSGTTSRLSYAAVFLAAVIHLLMIGSLLSEPFAFEHGVTLSGTRTHPLEKDEFKGFLDTWFHDTDRVPRGLDFFSIYQAGRNFLRGQSVFYGVREHRDGPDALVVPYFSGFRYLPVYAYTYGVALNTLPPWHSYWTWILFVELMLVFNLYATKWLPVSPAVRRTIMAMWLAYSPFYIEIHIGQQSMVTTTLIHLALITHMKQKVTLRDTSYVVSVLWKLNTALFLPLWIKLKRWKSIAALAVLSVTLSAPYFFLVEGSFKEFSSYFGHKFIAAGPNSLGFWAFLVQFLQLTPLSHGSVRHVLTLWSFIIITTATASTLLPRKICFYRALSMWICVYFLTYQYVWEHHFIMLLPVFSAGMLFANSRKWTVFLWLFCAAPTPYILFNDPSLPMPQVNWTLLQKAVYHGSKSIPVFIFFCVMAFQLFLSKNGAESRTSFKDSTDQLDLKGVVSGLRIFRKT